MYKNENEYFNIVLLNEYLKLEDLDILFNKNIEGKF